MLRWGLRGLLGSERLEDEHQTDDSKSPDDEDHQKKELLFGSRSEVADRARHRVGIQTTWSRFFASSGKYTGVGAEWMGVF